MFDPNDERLVISEKKRKLFDALLLILKEVDRVCKENDITYTANAGTLLGAVRHQGFIPWDDDIDLYMLRSDYEKFLKIAPEKLREPFFLSTTEREEGYYRYPARVRNSATTYFTSRDLEQIKAGRPIHYNCGIFLSIFPIDGVPKGKLACKIQEKTSKFRNKLLIANAYSVKNHWRIRLIRAYCNVVGYKNIFRRLEKSFTRYSCEGNDWWEVPDFYPHVKTNRIPAECFDEIIELPFEDMMIPCPKGYDRLLSQNYGNYMEFPPVTETMMELHGQFIDFDHSYREYLSGERSIENIDQYLKK